MSASRFGRRSTAAATVTGVLVAPLAVLATAVPASAAPVDIQILATNDYHGRLLSNTSFGAQEAGAAQLAGAVKQLESDYPDTTIFTAAGDLIGASTFESFIQEDKPTLDAMNAAGLDVSAAGNHEFDQGYDDLVNRVMAPYDATANPFGGAEWQYIAANVRKKSDSTYALPDVTAQTPDPVDTSDGGTWMTTVGGVDVGFVGAVTEDLPSLVSPDGIADVAVTDIVAEVNAGADALKADGADVVIMLVHEGASTTNISSLTDGSAFAQIVNGVDADVSAIVSGHTHLAYNHVLNGRPVVSAGQYGTNLNKLVFSVDPATGDVVVKSQQVVQANTVTLTDAEAISTRDAVAAMVQDAVDEAEVLGAQVLGEIAAPFNRARLASGSENRGGESTLGNLVAEVQRWATEDPSAGGAQIAFMNPGGLREDMVGNNTEGYPADLTYKQAAVVQPFANTLVNMDMTGAQVKTLLEQQWQRNADGTVPSRAFLRLGTSEGFAYTYNPARPEGDRITGMWLDGVPMVATTAYSVTANSFLAAGGDNFRAFTQATDKRDSGRVDLAAMVDYMAANSPVTGDPKQHAIGISPAAGSPASYAYGDHVKFDVSSWAFSTAADLKDTEIEVRMGDAVLGTFPVDNTIGTVANDEYGKSAIDVVVPTTVTPGARRLTLVGNNTGTRAFVPVAVTKRASTVKATADPATVQFKHETSDLAVTVASSGPVTGNVAALLDGKVIAAGELKDGKATLEVGPFDTIGTKAITVKYYGDDLTAASSTKVDVTVQKARPRVKVFGPKKAKSGRMIERDVSVLHPDFKVTGKVKVKVVGVKGSDKAKLRAGSATLELGRLKPGVYKVKYTFLGSDVAERVTKTVKLRVVR